MDIEWVTQSGFEYCIPGGLPEISVLKALLFYDKGHAQRYISLDINFNFHNAAFIAVGNCPDPQTAADISSFFINARFISCFGNDLLGSVLTCRFSLWTRKLDASFLILDNSLLIEFKSHHYSCPVFGFSLRRFCLLIGFRTGLRCVRNSLYGYL